MRKNGILTQLDTSTVGNNETTVDNFRSRKYVFTINNYTLTQKTQLYDYCQKSKNYIYGFEIGEKGTPHIQGWIEFKNPVYRTAFKKAVGGEFYIAKANGTWKENITYCKKDGEYETNMEIYSGPDIELYDWQKELVKILEEKPNDRDIHWVWEKVGCRGKTTFQKWYFANHDGVVTLSGRANDMKNCIVNYVEKNKRHPRVILINIPRSVEKLSYTGIEEIKDMYFFSGKYEGGMICGPCPHVMVFANEEPAWEKMSKDRWKIKDLNIYTDYLNI